MVSVAVLILVVGFMSYVLFLLWYGGRGRPLTAEKAEALLERVQCSAQAVGAPLALDLIASIREVIKDDDGQEFVMINLIRYRAKAVYPPGWTNHGDDPHAADARYNRVVIPLLLKRACIPVFLGRSAGRFLTPDGADTWDCVVLVRYRSRRDLLGLCADLAHNRADIHKWAAIEKTHVFPVRVSFSLITARLVVAGLVALVVLLAFLVACV